MTTYHSLQGAALKSVAIFVLFFAFSTSVYAGCGIVCTEPRSDGSPHAGDFETNGCLSGTGTLDTSTCDSGGGGSGGGGGGGGGGGSRTDLTASDISPVSVTSGVSQTYYATVYNGQLNAAATVTRFQRADDPNDASTPVVDTVSTASMNAYSSRTVSATYTHSGGSFYMRACADGNNQVAESDEGNNCGPWTLITVMPAPAQPQADLITGSVSVSNAIQGAVATFSAVASNIGSASSGSFPILFQVSETGARTNSAYIGALAPTASAGGTGSYKFLDSGIYNVRACANYDTAWNLITAESDASNNCSPWTEVVVAPIVTPALSCSVSASSVPVGGSVTYSANPSGGAAGPYVWTAADGGSYGSGSTATKTFSAPGTFAMNVDTSSTAVSYCPNVSVVSTACSTSGTNLSITATPSRVRAGETSTLSWTASGVNGEGASCTVSGPGISWTSSVTAAPQCSAGSSASATIATQSTYTLTCGGQSESVVVNVIPRVIEF